MIKTIFFVHYLGWELRHAKRRRLGGYKRLGLARWYYFPNLEI